MSGLHHTNGHMLGCGKMEGTDSISPHHSRFTSEFSYKNNGIHLCVLFGSKVTFFFCFLSLATVGHLHWSEHGHKIEIFVNMAPHLTWWCNTSKLNSRFLCDTKRWVNWKTDITEVCCEYCCKRSFFFFFNAQRWGFKRNRCVWLHLLPPNSVLTHQVCYSNMKSPGHVKDEAQRRSVGKSETLRHT